MTETKISNKLQQQLTHVHSTYFGKRYSKEEVFNYLLQLAYNKNGKIVHIPNIDYFVALTGCKNCAREIIQELKDEDIELCFMEDGAELYDKLGIEINVKTPVLSV